MAVSRCAQHDIPSQSTGAQARTREFSTSCTLAHVVPRLRPAFAAVPSCVQGTLALQGDARSSAPGLYLVCAVPIPRSHPPCQCRTMSCPREIVVRAPARPYVHPWVEFASHPRPSAQAAIGRLAPGSLSARPVAVARAPHTCVCRNARTQAGARAARFPAGASTGASTGASAGESAAAFAPQQAATTMRRTAAH